MRLALAISTSASAALFLAGCSSGEPDTFKAEPTAPCLKGYGYQVTTDFTTVGGGRGHGGSIEAAGPVVIDGAVLVTSGYLFGGRMPGNVLLKFKAR